MTNNIKESDVNTNPVSHIRPSLKGLLCKVLTDNEKIVIALLFLLYMPFIAKVPQSIWSAFFLPGSGVILLVAIGVGLLFALPGLSIAINRHFVLLLSLASMFTLLCIVSFVLSPEIKASLLLETTLRFIIFGALALVLIYSIDDFDIFWKYLIRSSYIVSFCGFFYYLSSLFYADTYSMPFSYALIIPMVVLSINFMKSHNWYDAVTILFLLLMVFARGSRGALVVLFAAAALFMFNWIFHELNKKVRKPIFIGIVASLVSALSLLIVNLQSVLPLTGRLLEKIGLGGRTITLFSQGEIFHLSGREEITESLLLELGKDPFAFHGIYGTGVVAGDFMHIDMGGMYAHNIVLELIFTFGIVTGLFMFALVIGIILVSFFIARKSSERNLLILFISLGLVPAFFSDILWINTPFWVLMALSSVIIVHWAKNRIQTKKEVKVV
ncbi:MAG: hypothetical protein FWG40_00090 [Peptococcaceae bacterium]|nr:hypothetical protein [Peptococcaceae bacterium]